MRLHSSTSGAVVTVLLGCSLASAQSTEQLPGFDLERLETNVGRGTLLVGNGELMVLGGLSVSLLGHYQHLPLVLSDGIQELQVVRSRATSLLSASYGVLPWLELSAQVPFVLWQQGDDPTDAGLAQLSAQGLGTPVLQARLSLMSRKYRQPVDLAADLGAGLPVGTGTALAGDAGPRFHARLVAGTMVGWLRPSIEAGVLFRPAILLDTTEVEAKPGASAEIRLGAGLATTGTGLRGELGLRTTLSPQVSLELLGGVRFPLLSGLDAFVMGGPGLGGAVGTPRFRVLAGVTFRDEPPPRIEPIDPTASRGFEELVYNEPPVFVRKDEVRSTPTHELIPINSLTRDDTPENTEGSPWEPQRPYQPGPHEKLVLRGEIPFAQGSSELPGVVPLLDQIALRMAELPKGGKVIVEGHAHTESSDMSNLALSLRRAQAIRRYLVNQGIPWGRVETRYFGSDWPVSSKPATEQERQLNRRAEVLVITESTPPATTQAPAP